MGFIEDIAKYVQKYAPQYGIKVCSPIIAQAVLESASGTSELAKNAHNYFGLKYRAGRCPTAIGIYYKVGSEQNPDGSYTSSAMQWMKFKNLSDGVKGYFDFINISNYANLKGVTDPKEYLQNIKQDGYATSINYVNNLLNVINKYNLTKYDTIVKYEHDNSNGGNNMNFKLAIDAGHGSNTAGKRTPDGYREHWANVKVASFFANAMDRCGVKYIKTGWDDDNSKDDADISLTQRQKIIKNAKCDYSISFHFNASGDGKTYNTGQGIETLISDKAPGDSKRLADLVHAQLIKGTKQKNRGVKRQALSMCNCSQMGTKASILIECAFMTNEYEAGLMQSDAFCKECAEETAKGFCEYVGIAYVADNGTTITPSVPTSTPNRSYLMKGDRGTEVKTLQENLNYVGYSCGNADGIFGSNTDSALRKFQQAYKLIVDGKYGNASKVALENAVANKKNTATTSTTYKYKGVDYSPVFDPTYYYNTYVDLRNAFGNNPKKLFNHFCLHGMSEGRKGNDNFDVNIYKKNYSDLRAVFGNNLPDYYKHYCQYGRFENRKAKG